MNGGATAQTLGGKRARLAAVLLLLAVHAALLAYSAARHSPTVHELAHLPAGICHWQFGMFELYRVNPPLPRMVAALPVLLMHPQTDWGNYQLDPLSRETIPMGIRFAKANGVRTLWLFTVARWASIPFCLLGAWSCYRWAGELWGAGAGLAALALWCFNPFVLGHGALVMPDVPAAAIGAFAAYRYWKWLRGPRWSAALAAGLALGLAELCKATLLVFFPLWLIVWALDRVWHQKNHAPSDETLTHSRHQAPSDGPLTRSVRSTITEALQLLVMFTLAVYLINLGYGFAGSCQPVGRYRFQSRVLSGKAADDEAGVGNRFDGTWMGELPVPLPRDYVQGIDRQRTDFEIGDRSYLLGRWQKRGWWYYYLFGLAIKTPLGTLAMLLLAGCLTLFSRADRERWRDEIVLLAPAIAILVLVSSQTGFSNHVRYAIPALPYLLTWCAKAARSGIRKPSSRARESSGEAAAASHANPIRQRGWCQRARGWAHSLLPRWRFGLVWLCVAASALESLAVYPHSLSFFNMAVGGPSDGDRYLLDSNLAWGQDLLHLKDWLDRHPEARPLRLAAIGWLDPKVLGIEYSLPPVGPSGVITDDERLQMANGRRHRAAAAHNAVGDGAPDDALEIPQSWSEVRSLAALGPQPGCYAIDVNFLHGTAWPAVWPGWRYQKIAASSRIRESSGGSGLNYEYFRHFDPIARAGYSFCIYHITAADADRVRGWLGLPLLGSR